LAGRVVAADTGTGMVLRKLDGPLRIAYRIDGLYPDDTWSGPRVTYTRLQCPGGRLTVDVTSDATLFRQVQSVSVEGRRVTSRPSQTRTLPGPMRRGADGACRAVFTVTPTAIPAAVLKGSTDTRELGAHFTSFRYTPGGSRTTSRPSRIRARASATTCSARSRARPKPPPVSTSSKPPGPAAAAGAPSLVPAPCAHATGRAWRKLGRPPAERSVGGLAALHFTDWMYPPQRGGVRATMIHDLGPLKYPEKLHRRTVSMHTSN